MTIDQPPSDPDGTNQSDEVASSVIAKRSFRLTRFVIVCVFLLTGGAIYLWSRSEINRDLQAVTSIGANSSVTAEAHYDSLFNRSTLVFDITGLSGASRLDVFRVLLQFAEREKSNRYSQVVLSRGGTPRYVIDGAYFQQLGEEYSSQNPMYTLRTFPAHVMTPSGSQPYGEYEGGAIAVLAKEMEQFNQFMDEWTEQ